jgi:hypothetical protein
MATKPKALLAPPLSAADKANPNKLHGDDLRALAHQRGMAKSLLANMPDEKIRAQIRYIDYGQYGQ